MFRTRTTLAAAVTAVLAVTAGTLATAPAALASAAAVAVPAASTASSASTAEVIPFPVASQIVSAGATGFLSKGPGGEHRWTRYSDGTSTVLASWAPSWAPSPTSS